MDRVTVLASDLNALNTSIDKNISIANKLAARINQMLEMDTLNAQTVKLSENNPETINDQPVMIASNPNAFFTPQDPEESPSDSASETAVNNNHSTVKNNEFI